MKKQHETLGLAHDVNSVRPFARAAARELTPEEIDAVAGGGPDTTHATGPNGDDPSDPGV